MGRCAYISVWSPALKPAEAIMSLRRCIFEDIDNRRFTVMIDDKRRCVQYINDESGKLYWHRDRDSIEADRIGIVRAVEGIMVAVENDNPTADDL